MARRNAQDFETAHEIRRRYRAPDPLAYMFGRFKNAKPGPEKDQLAKDLIPYCHRKLAPEPVPEAKEAMKRGQLVILPHPGADAPDE